MKFKDEDILEVWDLYIYKFYSIEQLEEEYKGKFTYSQLRDMIKIGYEMYENSKKSIR